LSPSWSVSARRKIFLHSDSNYCLDNNHPKGGSKSGGNSGRGKWQRQEQATEAAAYVAVGTNNNQPKRGSDSGENGGCGGGSGGSCGGGGGGGGGWQGRRWQQWSWQAAMAGQQEQQRQREAVVDKQWRLHLLSKPKAEKSTHQGRGGMIPHRKAATTDKEPKTMMPWGKDRSKHDFGGESSKGF
jgi:hypothetical protein